MRAFIALFLALITLPAAAASDCPIPVGTTVPGWTGDCLATDICTQDDAGSCQIVSCPEGSAAAMACCTSVDELAPGQVYCVSRGGDLVYEIDDLVAWDDDPTWWAEIVGIPWWTILWREVSPEPPRDPRHITAESERAGAVLTFDYVDGSSWVTIEGEVSGGLYSPVYVAGGNSNGSSGQDCTGPDDTRCFGALTLAWGNAYSNASGPGAFVLTSTDGSVRLACDRGPVVVAGQTIPMGVHSCTTAWAAERGLWSTPTTCGGPQGADLGACVGYAWDMSH